MAACAQTASPADVSCEAIQPGLGALVRRAILRRRDGGHVGRTGRTYGVAPRAGSDPGSSTLAAEPAGQSG